MSDTASMQTLQARLAHGLDFRLRAPGRNDRDRGLCIQPATPVLVAPTR
jgi:hypothetical protein